MTQLLCHVLSDKVDRVREIVNVGAGHAAGALAELIGETCWMDVPKVVNLCCGEGMPLEKTEEPEAAVFFEVEGELGGTVVLRFPERTANHLVERLLKGERSERLRESSLKEIGNILASHAVGAMGGLLGDTLHPSVPVLVPNDAGAALLAVCSTRRSAGGTMRVETTLRDAGNTYRIGLCYIPKLI